MALLMSRSVLVSRAAAPRPMAFCSPVTASRSAMLTSARPSLASSSSFMGGSSFGSASLLMRVAPAPRGTLQVVANAKKSIGCTKEGTNRKAAQVSGFRARQATATGRKILKLRRKKGRHVLCKISMASSAGKK